MIQPEPNVETITLAYQESVETVNELSHWYESLDTKIVGVFGVSSVMAGLAPTLVAEEPSGWGVTAWVIALLAWATSATACFWAFRIRDYRIDPNPKTLLNEAWLRLEPSWFRYYRLCDVAETYHNRSAYRGKLAAVSIAIAATAIEVISLAVALLWGRISYDYTFHRLNLRRIRVAHKPGNPAHSNAAGPRRALGLGPCHATRAC